MAFARLRDSPMANSKMSPARLMFRRILRFPGLPTLPDNVDEVVAGEEKQARKVVDKEKRNKKVRKKRWWSLRKGCTSFCKTTRQSCLKLKPRSS